MIKIKLLILFVFFIPLISNGFVESGTFEEDDDSKEVMEVIKSNLIECLKQLHLMTTDKHSLSLQLISFLKQDFNKAKSFIEDYNKRDLAPKWPLASKKSEMISNIPFREVRFWLGFSSHRYLFYSGIFSKVLEILTESLESLEFLKEKHPAMENKLQKSVENGIVSVIQQLESPTHSSPEQLTSECEKEFTRSFISGKKKSSGAN